MTRTTLPQGSTKLPAIPRPSGPLTTSSHAPTCVLRTAILMPADAGLWPVPSPRQVLWLTAMKPLHSSPRIACSCWPWERSLVSERTPTSAPSSANVFPHQRPHSRAADLEPAVWSATTLVRREPFHETSSPTGCPRKRPKMIRLPTLASARFDGETPSNKLPASVSEVRGESAAIFAHTRPRRGARQADLEPRQMARDYGRRIYTYNQFFNCLPGTDFAEGADHTLELLHC